MSQPQYAQEKLLAIQERIEQAILVANRDPNCVRLIGASKQQTSELISEYLKFGLHNLGENYLQEAVTKIETLSSHNASWHFIGQIQSNKTKVIAEHFDWVHGVDRLKIAKRLAAQNTQKQSLKLLLQLNLDDEQSKAGIKLADAPALADEIAQYVTEGGKAELRGFMAIPKARDSKTEQAAIFAKATELLSTTNQRYGLQMDQLSMGMSGDLEAAIQEGATMVRIGTDLFGARR